VISARAELAVPVAERVQGLRLRKRADENGQDRSGLPGGGAGHNSQVIETELFGGWNRELIGPS
jgi:hypothetical protein